MKKTAFLYASFVLIAAPVSSNAEITPYAEILPAIISSDVDGDWETDFEDQGSLVGVQGEKTLGDGSLGFAALEIEYNADEDEVALSAAYAGLSNRAGTFLLGRIDAISTEIVPKADIFDILGSSFGEDVDVQDLAAYQFGLGQNISGGIALMFDVLDAEEENEEDVDAVDFGIDFGFSLATIGFGYTQFDDEADSDLVGAGVEVGIGKNALLAAHVEDHSEDGMSYHVVGQMTAGSNIFRLGYGKNDEVVEDASTLGFSHSFDEAIILAVEFETTDDVDTAAIGMVIEL